MSDTQTGETPRIDVAAAASADAAWQALRDPAVIRQWHGWDTDELESEIDSIYFTDVVEEAEKRTLVVNGGDRFEVRPDGDGSRITLTRAPLSGDPEMDAYYDDITEGWRSFLHQLRFALERRPGTRRRTLFFADRGTYSGTVIERLGLDAVAGQSAGSRYAATVAGEDVAGEVWFRSANQLGATVDAWGEGLLVIAGTAPSEADPAGTSMAILSTYDLDDNDFGQLETRWAAWWADH
jgi:hypothetical protein